MTDVLIIEPSKEFSEIVAQALARSEISSISAHTAQSAIKLADKYKPKVIIMELLMPKHNGLEFIHEFRSYSDWLGVPIIIYSQLSADELDISIKTKNDMGVISHLYKPTASLQSLVNAVEDSLNRTWA